MSVKDFKFVSPGVFIQEIDNSFVPKSADTIGPVIIGRARRGISMQPVKVESYSEFVEIFGDTVPGNAGGDVSRSGVDLQSPMYGTYAAKAFLRSNVAPLTYVRLLGHDVSDAETQGYSGWKTDNFMSGGVNAGGATGLFVAQSSSNGPYTGTSALQLAAIFYNDKGGAALKGTIWGSGSDGGTHTAAATMITSDANGVFTMTISGSDAASSAINFSLNDNSENYIRKKFNTNPQLRVGGDFYNSAVEKDWWLGETFDQEIKDAGLDSAAALVGVLTGIQLSGSSTYEGPANMHGQSARESISGWFIGQDLGDSATFNVENDNLKLFRLHGRGHGKWLSENCKVSIEKIRPSSTTTSDFGTFSIVIRAINDSDNSPQVLERFDNLNLNPESDNYILQAIGDQYYTWNEDLRTLQLNGEDGYANRSKYIRVEVSSIVKGGGSPTLVPFGYYAGPKLSDITVGLDQSGSVDYENQYIIIDQDLPDYDGAGRAATAPISASVVSMTGTLAFPVVRLRNSASDGGLVNYRDAYFGMQTTRTSGSTQALPGVYEANNLWTQAAAVSDPSTLSVNGVDAYAYIFTLDNIRTGSSTTGFYYESGSHVDGNSVTGRQSGSASSYKTLLDKGINQFTAPFFGGTDGFNIRVPDPMYNAGMSSTSTNQTDYIYYTWKRAIDTVADPEFVNMNALAAPGLGLDNLTGHMVSLCEARADTLALIDLQDAYKPEAEGGFSSITNSSERVTYTATQLANNLKDRRIDSSYGATFYPWVQTRDQNTGQLVWIPPTVAMMGVLGSSERKSKIWFAPAGFNRGGLSDGAAGIPITQVTTRLSSRDRDTLYEARINPIASFPSTGIVVFGQKTLQERQSALDRINVRRLVIYLKKQISILSTQILFEQNVQATWNRFKGLIDPFLANVTTEYGITDYRLVLDESTTTADLIDQNIMYAKIMIKPARAIEYIAIDFVIASTGASFDD